MVTIPEDEYLAHYGTPRHSGRYPWGSGHDDEGTQRNKTLLGVANELRAKGLSETDVARGLNMTTTQLRDLRTIVRNEQRQDQIHMAQQLRAKGMSNVAIAKQMTTAVGKPIGESQVRSLLQPSQERRAKVLDNVADTLRRAVDEKKYLDVGAGTEFQLDTTSTQMRAALRKLQNEGYQVFNNIQIEQLGTGNQTNLKVLTAADKQWRDVQQNKGNIKQLTEYSDDGGLTSLGIVKPLPLSSSRVGIRYAEQGGTDADGVMYVRPGVKDVSLGSARYAQVRVLVDGTHYIKGMAVYKDDLPEGTDVLFNTNKSNTGNKLDALKKISDDPDNPFGATVRQIGDVDPDTGKKKLTSVMNLVNEEGDWNKWSKTLSSQMLSKQRPALAKEQLDQAAATKKAELEGILSLTNPSVKLKLLAAYADGADASAVHLKAAALPRQKTQVILPVPELKENEVHAPNFNDGEHVVLVRFPHGGTFEIPELVVNNKNPVARKVIPNDSSDAIGIHPKVAERLSGADFDGDTVLVIPNNLGKVTTRPALEALRGFNPKESYPEYPGMPKMSSHTKGLEMGKISNLITDMTIAGANTDELARAVKHSMVVIDAEKHNLDYKRSYADNGIAALVKRYQSGTKGGGASTLISRASSRQDVLDRKERSPKEGGPIDPKTGKKVYVNTGKGKTWVDANGETHTRLNTIQSTKLGETDDAHTLSSGTVIEKLYADHSNKLKALANQARKASLGIKTVPYSPSAKETYSSEVAELNSKLTLALRNAPLERQAQVFANAIVRQKVQAEPSLKSPESKVELRRLKAQALSAARARTGADKPEFTISDGEWAAIQAGAITKSKLDQILTYADLARVKELATPKVVQKLKTSDVSRGKSMLASGYTLAEVAQALGVSVSTVQRDVTGKEAD